MIVFCGPSSERSPPNFKQKPWNLKIKRLAFSKLGSFKHPPYVQDEPFEMCFYLLIISKHPILPHLFEINESSKAQNSFKWEVWGKKAIHFANAPSIQISMTCFFPCFGVLRKKIPSHFTAAKSPMRVKTTSGSSGRCRRRLAMTWAAQQASGWGSKHKVLGRVWKV